MSSIIKLGEKRGEIYYNGVLEINEELWDRLKASFDEYFADDDWEGENE